MLYYCPLEPYPERYTAQLSAPGVGWFERNWRRAGVEYVRIEGTEDGPSPISTGRVVDVRRRPRHCFRQVEELLRLAESGELTDGDAIYLDDFWHPGIEAMFYALDLMDVHPRTYAYLWAQSVDEFDFTHPMRRWMRPLEKGIGEHLTGIFVACPSLRDLVVAGGIATADKVHVVGLPFDSREVRSRMLPPGRRESRVVFSSRWDREKDPLFFLRVVREILSSGASVRFVVCTSSPQLRSNDPDLLEALRSSVSEFPGRLIVREGLSKEEYYAVLCGSKVQFNCADQDWVSFTLLESSVAGCYPLYPEFRSFPETFLGRGEFLYRKGDVVDASRRIMEVMGKDDLWDDGSMRGRRWVHERFDGTWLRILERMGVPAPDVSPEERSASLVEPFA